jgi:hypothetical protein
MSGPTSSFASQQIICKITTGGVLGTMACQFSQAGSSSQISATGSSWDCPATFAPGNIITFPAGTYVLNDVYEWRIGDTNATRVIGTGAPVPTCRSRGATPGIDDLPWP